MPRRADLEAARVGHSRAQGVLLFLFTYQFVVLIGKGLVLVEGADQWGF